MSDIDQMEEKRCLVRSPRVLDLTDSNGYTAESSIEVKIKGEEAAAEEEENVEPEPVADEGTTDAEVPEFKPPVNEQ